MGVVTGDVFHLWPRAISTEWFSGLAGGEKGSGIVIPVSAVSWVEGGPVSSRDETPSLVAATLRDVLTDMARRRAHVTVRTHHLDATGVMVSVGSDFCDLALHPAPHPSATRRFPFHAIVAIFQGAFAWG